MTLVEMDVARMDSDGVMTPGEVTRTLQRIERGVERIDQQLIPEALRQISQVRHRVSNLEQRDVLGQTFFEDYNHLKEEVRRKAEAEAVEELEKNAVAREAIDGFKKFLWTAVILGGGGLLVSILILLSQPTGQ